ncbi:MAG TPA: FAD binding domain-containing protein [Burkholderiaceae bacterium]|nr:FAD binding domain-containing protein [Burkholderiaceae bacterium]
MKAAPFDYVRAESEAHALEVLQQHGAEAKLVAGGQSLVPMMAMRLARPAVLVDINRLATLKGVEEIADAIRMRACTRQRDVEHDERLRSRLPLVAQALHWVGHIQTRNRGTVGGSLVHADPSAELPLAAAVLAAKLHVRSQSGVRVLNAAEFFQGPMFTATGETECLVAIDWPVWKGARIGSAFDETSIRHGDFAMASAACQLQLDESGVCQGAAFGYGGVDGTPLAFPELASQLVGQRVTPQVAREIARSASTRCEPGDDIHATATFRRHLAAVLGERVLLKAAENARGASH